MLDITIFLKCLNANYLGFYKYYTKFGLATKYGFCCCKLLLILITIRNLNVKIFENK